MSASAGRQRAQEPPSHDDSVDLVGIGLFVVSLAAAAALVLAAYSPDLVVALIAVACLSMVAFLATFRLTAPPGSAGTRRILATLSSLVVVAAFLKVSASPLALVLPTSAATLAALVGRTRLLTLAALLVAAASSTAAVAG